MTYSCACLHNKWHFCVPSPTTEHGVLTGNRFTPSRPPAKPVARTRFEPTLSSGSWPSWPTNHPHGVPVGLSSVRGVPFKLVQSPCPPPVTTGRLVRSEEELRGGGGVQVTRSPMKDAQSWEDSRGADAGVCGQITFFLYLGESTAAAAFCKCRTLCFPRSCKRDS